MAAHLTTAMHAPLPARARADGAGAEHDEARGDAHGDAYESDALRTARDPLEAAREHIVLGALRESPVGESPVGQVGQVGPVGPIGRVGRVGLELEAHLVDLARPARRPGWADVQAVVGALPPMPSGSAVTVEPGGQLELSTPPAHGVAASVALLRADRAVLRDALAQLGYGAAPLGTDPARPVRRVNPSGRYVAMEEHFAALGCPEPGRAMMSATAALQVNLDAGPAAGWAQRLRLIRDLCPVLVAMSACSPLLAGRASGWRSMRQQIWHDLAQTVGPIGLDRAGREPFRSADPAGAWAAYALAAPIMLVRAAPGAVDARPRAMTERVPFSAWLAGVAPIARRPTTADLDYHLTTLFPPLRPRGYLELRCLDAVADRWWPALATVVATLVDDPVAADRAAELCVPVRDSWRSAAQHALGDPQLATAVTGCLEVAEARCPADLRGDVGALAELIASSRTPGDEVGAAAASRGPLAALEEAARA